MKFSQYILYSLFAFFLLTGCEKEEENLIPEPEVPGEGESGIQDGYFVADFGSLFQDTRAAISGPDARVQHIRYILYKSDGTFVKERVLLVPGTTPTWPFSAVRDTLPKGSYKAIFLANVEKTLFPYATQSNPTNYNEVLQNYKVNYSSARIMLPNAEFKNNTEYYWANVTFSNSNPNPSVLLQRVIGLLDLHRNFIDAQQALNQLVNNIGTQVGYRNILKTTAQGLLGTKLGAIGGLGDALINPVIAAVIEPVTDTLYNRLLRGLVNQIGIALQGNSNQPTTVAKLGVLLNPWNDASTAIVTINNFPKSMDFDLNVKEYYTGNHNFRYDFRSNIYSEKRVLIKGFGGVYDVRKINVIKQGLVGGLLFDDIIDGSLLLDGSLIDINDAIAYAPGYNYRYKSDYSFVDLRLKSYTAQNGNSPLTVSVQLGQIANIDNLIGPIVGLLPGVSALIKNITIEASPNLPLLGISNLTITGGWSTPTSY